MAKVKATLIRRNSPEDQNAMQQALVNDPVKNPVSMPVKPDPSPIDQSPDFLIGQTYKLPLYQIQKSEHNARVFYSTEELDEMSKSLTEKGQDVPAIGYLKDERVVLIDGQKRYQASINANLSTLTVLIVDPPKNECEEYEESRRINLQRSTHTALDDAVRWDAMIKKGIYESQDELAERLGVSKANISKTIGITRIPDKLLRNMSLHQQTRAMSIAYEISTMFAPGTFDTLENAEYAANDIIDEVVKKELSRNKVEALIKSRLDGPKTRARAMSTTIKYGENEGTLKVYPARGQIALSFKGLPEEQVEELRVRIEQMLAGQLSI